MSEKHPITDLPIATLGSAAQARGPQLWSIGRKGLSLALAALALVHLVSQLVSTPFLTLLRPKGVHWKACGTGLECTTIVAPLDWHNASDPRTVHIAVAKYPADKSKQRLGSIFINPGGPGGSGTQFAHMLGAQLAVIAGGQYVSRGVGACAQRADGVWRRRMAEAHNVRFAGHCRIRPARRQVSSGIPTIHSHVNFSSS